MLGFRVWGFALTVVGVYLVPLRLSFMGLGTLSKDP